MRFSLVFQPLVYLSSFFTLVCSAAVESVEANNLMQSVSQLSTMISTISYMSSVKYSPKPCTKRAGLMK
jgi:hypothetical protein